MDQIWVNNDYEANDWDSFLEVEVKEKVGWSRERKGRWRYNGDIIQGNVGLCGRRKKTLGPRTDGDWNGFIFVKDAGVSPL